MRLTTTIKRLLIAYVAMFVVQKGADQFFGAHLQTYLALIPSQVLNGQIWQFFTYSFLHADVMHLVLNCLVLAFLGAEIESLWGTKRFLVFYFICTTAAAFFYMLAQLLISNPMYMSLPMVGASGGIYGLLMAYGVLFADRQLLFMMMFPLPARQFVWVLVAVEFLQALFSGQGGLSAIAHLAGLATGYGLLWFQAQNFNRSRLGKALKSKSRPGHLRLVEDKDAKNKDDLGPKGPRTWH